MEFLDTTESEELLLVKSERRLRAFSELTTEVLLVEKENNIQLLVLAVPANQLIYVSDELKGFLTVGVASTGIAQIPATTVASLPVASIVGAGVHGFVTDANDTTFLSVVAAGGVNKVPVVSDGTNWLIG